MDFAELVRSRRTIHNFTDEAVDDALVREALALGLWSPNHKMTLPIRYVWAGPRAREGLIDLALELKVDANEIKRRAIREKLAQPAHLVALAVKRAEKPMTRHEDYATLAAGVQNASLFLWRAGVGTKWSSASWSIHPRAYDILGLDAREVELEGCLLIGRAKHVPPTPERPPLDDILTRVD